MHKTVTLSDGAPCKVRVLGLFELDSIEAQVLGPYTYSILTVTGQVLEDVYDIHALDRVPERPAEPEPEPKTEAWYQLQEYETYLAAVAHERKRVESYEDRLSDIAAYILDNCLGPDDHNRIITPDDWQAVYTAALIPALTEEVITATLRDTFPGLVWDIRDIAGAQGHSQGQGPGVGDAAVGA